MWYVDGYLDSHESCFPSFMNKLIKDRMKMPLALETRILKQREGNKKESDEPIIQRGDHAYCPYHTWGPVTINFR